MNTKLVSLTELRVGDEILPEIRERIVNGNFLTTLTCAASGPSGGYSWELTMVSKENQFKNSEPGFVEGDILKITKLNKKSVVITFPRKRTKFEGKVTEYERKYRLPYNLNVNTKVQLIIK